MPFGPKEAPPPRGPSSASPATSPGASTVGGAAYATYQGLEPYTVAWVLIQAFAWVNLLVGAFTNGQVGFDRPFRGAGTYRTHLPGLYLCGSSSHPGGSITSSLVPTTPEPPAFSDDHMLIAL